MSPTHAQSAKVGPRQAVVLIHGIGEQRPMETLRGFVGTLLKPRSYYSKPDTLSDSFELRRIKLRRDEQKCLNLEWPETDFYEYYWAHQMYGTTASHVVKWCFRTLRRAIPFLGVEAKHSKGVEAKHSKDDARLRWLANFAWLVALAILGASVVLAWLLWTRPPAVPTVGIVAFALILLRGAFSYVPKAFLGAVLDFAGDAARYFDVNPKNVARRYDILRGGIALLEKLHQDRDERDDEVMYRYGRVVLVGHSLGSVIAYDILRHYWGEVNARLDVTSTDLTEVESFSDANCNPPFLDAKPYHDADRFRQAQQELWKDMSTRVPAGAKLLKDELWWQRVSSEAAAPSSDKAPPDWKPARWLVSDLVTLGSPLTYAPVLLAAGNEDLEEKKRLRELPTCPPDRSVNLNPGHFVVDLSAEAERFDRYQILHHSALFALIRWTNLWYLNDPIGGPLSTLFGSGIDDVPLRNVSISPAKSHVSYLRSGQGDECKQRLKVILTGRTVS